MVGQEAFFAGKVEVFRNQLTLTNPEVALGDDAEDFAGGLMPVYPATAKLPSWRLRKAVRVALDVALPEADPLADPLPAELRLRRGLTGLADALRLGPPARHPRRRTPGQGPAALRRGVRAADRAGPAPGRDDGPAGDRPGAAAPAACSTRSTTGCRSPSPTGSRRSPPRSPPTWPASTRCTGCSRARSARARRWSRCARCSPWSTAAARRRCSPPPRCSRSSTTAPSPRCSARWPSAACSAAPTSGTRVALLTGSQATAARRTNLLDIVSGDAGIVDRHPRADPGHRRLPRPRPGRRRRAAPVRRRAARRPAQQGEGAAAPAGDDRDPDPAHGGDDGVRRPRRLDADRAAGRPVADRLARRAGGGEAALPRAGLEAGPRGGRRRPPGLRRLPPDRRHGPEEPRTARRRAGRRDEDRPPRCGPPLAVLDVTPMLVDGPLAGLRVEMLHGRLPPDAKDDVMRRFAAGEVDVLVATTVVEVGVDVANATAMVVLDADRFGVSQLHQLRGRVGRGVGARAVPARHRRRGRYAGPRPPRRGRGHPGRLRALPARPRDPPRGRRARRLAVRAAVQPAAALGAAGRGGHRRGPRGRRRAGRRGPGPRDAPRAARRGRGGAGRRSGPSTWRRRDPGRSPAPPAAAGSPCRRATAPGPPPTGPGRPCSPPSSRWSAPGPAAGCSTCTPGPAPSGSRRSAAAPRTRCWSSPTRGPARTVGRQRRDPRAARRRGAAAAGSSGSPPHGLPGPGVRRGVRRPALRPDRRRRCATVLADLRPAVADDAVVVVERATRGGAWTWPAGFEEAAVPPLRGGHALVRSRDPAGSPTRPREPAVEEGTA